MAITREAEGLAGTLRCVTSLSNVWFTLHRQWLKRPDPNTDDKHAERTVSTLRWPRQPVRSCKEIERIPDHVVGLARTSYCENPLLMCPLASQIAKQAGDSVREPEQLRGGRKRWSMTN